MITITINPITLNPNANHEADVGGGGRMSSHASVSAADRHHSPHEPQDPLLSVSEIWHADVISTVTI